MAEPTADARERKAPAAAGAAPADVPAPPANDLSTTIAVVIAIGALYFGREILVPLALAILLGFVMTPPVQWLRRHGIPRVGAVIVVVAMATVGVGAVALAVGTQLVQLAENLPSYQQNIAHKLSTLRSSAPGASVVERVSGTLDSLRRQLSSPSGAAAPQTPGADPAQEPPKPAPVPVVVEPGPMQPLEVLQTYVGPILGPLGTAALVVLFTIFILIEREDLRDRFIRLVGGADLQRSTEAISDAGQRVSRYLLMQVVVNVTYGFPIGLGLYVIGVPNAVLWGVLATVLRFIPYLGPWLAALFPLTLAFGVDPGWSMLLWTIALFLVVELVSNNAVEPWLYGSSTGLSSFAVILSAIFWTVLWGPVGLFLATPLTVCLVVIGRYVPRFEVLGTLLGSEPVLDPAERLYQRLLAGNVEEAVEMAEDHVDEAATPSLWDEVALPALRLAEADRHRSSDVEYRRRIADGMTAVVHEVEEHVRERLRKLAGKKATGGAAREAAPTPVRVLCIGGRSELDLAAAEMVAARLREIGIGARTAAPISVAQSAIGRLDLEGIEVVCLSYLSPRPHVLARYVARRLLRRAPHLELVAGCWSLDEATTAARDLEERLGSRATVVARLADAERAVRERLETDPAASATASGPEHEQDLAAEAMAQAAPLVARMREMGLAAGKGEAFEQLGAAAAARLGVPAVLVALADTVCRAGASPREGKPAGSEELAASICSEVIAGGKTLVVDSVADHDQLADNAELLEKGIRFVAAAPLVASNGAAVGALCVLGTEERELDAEQLATLESLAGELMHRVEAAEARATGEAGHQPGASAAGEPPAGPMAPARAV